MISFVWAEDKNHLIGATGQLPWSLPNDMKSFKEITKGHPLVMGRKTFESFPNGPLPGRENIVVTRNVNFTYPGVTVVHDIREIKMNPEENYCVIGGSQIFELYKDTVDKLYVTRIDHEFAGDTYMIELPWNEFQLIKQVAGKIDDKNVWKHTFEEYIRK